MCWPLRIFIAHRGNTHLEAWLVNKGGGQGFVPHSTLVPPSHLSFVQPCLLSGFHPLCREVEQVSLAHFVDTELGWLLNVDANFDPPLEGCHVTSRLSIHWLNSNWVPLGIRFASSCHPCSVLVPSEGARRQQRVTGNVLPTYMGARLPAWREVHVAQQKYKSALKTEMMGKTDDQNVSSSAHKKSKV